MSTIIASDQLMTTGAVARLAGVDRVTVARWCNAQVLPSFRVGPGRVRLIPATAVGEFLRERKAEVVRDVDE